MYQAINHNYDLQITTLTPVSIGNGKVLSPYADYVYDERTNEAHFINKEIINTAVKSNSLEDQYIEAIYASFDNNRSNFDLKTFIEKKLDLAAKDYASQSVPCYGMQRSYRREVKAMLKNNGQPYISGSTLKGAIKTALLYDWLRNEGWGEFKTLMSKLEKKYYDCKDLIEDLENINSKRHLSPYDKKEIRRLSMMVVKNSWGLEKAFKDIFNQLIDEEQTIYPKDFSNIRLGDSSLLAKEDRCFQLTNRIHYRKGTSDIPVNLEAIRENSNCKVRFSITPYLQKKELQFLNQKDGIRELFSRINKFSKDNIDLELELINQFDWFKTARHTERKVFKDYQQFLENLYDKLDNLSSENEAYLTLGFGKSFFYNSIGMLVRDWKSPESAMDSHELSMFRKYCQLFFLGKIGQKSFPVTRTVTSFGKPMGWIKIQF